MENKQCRQCHKTFKITDSDQSFYDRIDVPTPIHCSDCRTQRRMAHRNETSLYQDECDLCHRKMLSIYSNDKPFIVYCPDCFYSDKSDPRDHGIDFNFNESFFSQFKKLQYKVPRLSLIIEDCDNCDYTNIIGYSKNCYLISGSINCENCYYGNPYNCVDCVDNLRLIDSELCYECINSINLYNCFYCQDCFNSNNLKYCYDCKECSDCIGCAGLRNKKYCIYNKQYSEREYKDRAEKINLCDSEKVKYLVKNFDKVKLKHVHIFMTGIKNENVSGNYINNSKNAIWCFDVDKVENGQFINRAIDIKDCYDITNTENAELCYEVSGGNRINNCRFDLFIWKSNNLDYCERCSNSHDLFGCTSMNKQEYCIFNKQYSKTEYQKLKQKIVAYMKKTGEWGELFSIEDSLFCYNETIAQDYFPLKKENTIEKKWKWFYKEKNKSEIKIKFKILRDIKKVDRDICKQVLFCKFCKSNYKLIPQELDFYKRQGIPIPRNCHNCRRSKRMDLCTPLDIWHRQCMCTQPNHGHQGKCPNAFETTYSPERKELVYCEDCYNREIY